MLSRSSLLWVPRAWSFGDEWPSVEYDLELPQFRDKAAGLLILPVLLDEEYYLGTLTPRTSGFPCTPRNLELITTGGEWHGSVCHANLQYMEVRAELLLWDPLKAKLMHNLPVTGTAYIKMF